jgi:predicted ThiF/HesA family dinucleotide-utilizing enzyme
MDVDKRTTEALGDAVMAKLASLRFCIVGCGGTGANFAEMLVRTGACRLTLVDGTVVEESNLNRVFSFSLADCGKPKVEVLKRYLKRVRPGLEINALQDSFRRPEHITDSRGQLVRDAVHDSDVVFVATDTNTSRLAIEELHRNKNHGMLLSCGVYVDRESDVFEFECTWSPATPPALADNEGYGPENASFASLVHEATSVAFTMLLSHLAYTDSDFRWYRRTYDARLRPIATEVNQTSSGSRP